MTELMRDNEGIDKAIHAGVQQALRVHKLLAIPLPWDDDGKVVIDPARGNRTGRRNDRPSQASRQHDP